MRSGNFFSLCAYEVNDCATLSHGLEAVSLCARQWRFFLHADDMASFLVCGDMVGLTDVTFPVGCASHKAQLAVPKTLLLERATLIFPSKTP